MNGAIPALRGYRKQFLYTLNKILFDTDGKYIFYPEGKEDLDISDAKGVLISLHQVKAYSKVLTYSDIKSFIARAIEDLSQNTDLTAELVSFGDFGEELEGVKSGDKKAIIKFTNKLKKSGFNKQQIELVFNKIKWVKVDEYAQYKEIDQFLSNNPLVSGDPKTAFQLLIFWVYLSAENRQLITHNALIEKLHDIGKWITERELHHQEWNVSIKLLETYPFDSLSKKKLQNEIDEGISVNYQHIVSLVDIERPIWLEQIHDSFRNNNLVILHGASGQGKSALAYRYIYNYLPKDWAFQIHALDDRKRALEITTALIGYTQSLQIPIFLYIDVSPQDEGWSELALQLSRLKNIKILVTIREEDWRKASFERASVSFRELLLEFNKTEAEGIYQSYAPQKTQSGVKFLDFEDIWNKFGGKGPLLEFTYLLKKHETLHARLKSQINRIQKDVDLGKRSVAELTLLKLVAVAGAYEAKLDLKKVVDFLELLTPTRTIELLEEEYLLRQSTDSSLLTGLHSIRCKIMSEILLDEVLDPWEATAKLCLSLVDPSDIQQFLLNAFVGHIDSRQFLADKLVTMKWDNWTSFGGAGKALIWLGIRFYVDANKNLFDEVYDLFGDAYWILIDFDLVGMLDEDFSSQLLDLFPDNEEKRKQIESLKSRQKPTNQAFNIFSDWVCKVEPPKDPCKNNSDFKLAGQLAYWTAHIGHQKKLYNSLDLKYYSVSILKNIDIH